MTDFGPRTTERTEGWPVLDRATLLSRVRATDERAWTEPVLRTYGRFVVVRDDLLYGGTKSRFVLDAARAHPEVREWVFAGPAWGGASIAITSTCFTLGLRATMFYSKRGDLVPRQQIVGALGGRLVECEPGYLTTVRARARAYCEANPEARLIEWGVPESEEAIVRIARQIDTTGISEVWCAMGSGTLLRGLRRAFAGRRLAFHAVSVGGPISEEQRTSATIHEYPREFAWRTKAFVPFSSCRHYDAKAWEIAQERSRGRVLFWNVARDATVERDLLGHGSLGSPGG